MVFQPFERVRRMAYIILCIFSRKKNVDEKPCFVHLTKVKPGFNVYKVKTPAFAGV